MLEPLDARTGKAPSSALVRAPESSGQQSQYVVTICNEEQSSKEVRT